MRVVPDWDTAYYNDFTRYGGESPMVVSYASSPLPRSPSPPSRDEAPTGDRGVIARSSTPAYWQEPNTRNSAGDLIDFMLSVEFQETIPLTWFVFPANRNADLPPEFVENTTSRVHRALHPGDNRPKPRPVDR